MKRGRKGKGEKGDKDEDERREEPEVNRGPNKGKGRPLVDTYITIHFNNSQQLL